MKTYLINLLRRPDRKAKALAECAKAGISPILFPAVDGRYEEPPDGWPAGAGAWGCSLSHRGVLSECLRDGTDEVMILEDDVSFVPDFQTRLAEFMALVPDDWDALMLGGEHLSPPLRINESVVRAVNCHRTHAYIVRGKYIGILNWHWSTEMGHIDQVWARHQLDAGINVYAATRFLAAQGANLSDIDGGSHGYRQWSPRRIVPAVKPCTGCGSRTPISRPLPPPGRRWRR